MLITLDFNRKMFWLDNVEVTVLEKLLLFAGLRCPFRKET